VSCALAIVIQVQQLGLESRAGVHTGECERLGADVGGIAVHIGARVAGLASRALKCPPRSVEPDQKAITGVLDLTTAEPFNLAAAI